MDARLFPALNKLKIVITAGPTREKIDPVRYITNESSGQMGYEIAAAAIAGGAQVVLVSGPTNLACPDKVKRISVVSAEEMYQAVLKEVKDADIFIGVAAVADFSPVKVSSEKIKKATNTDTLSLTLKKNPDIIASVANLEKRPFTVGFAAETQDLLNNAVVKLVCKNLDMICANLVSENKGFNKDLNEITVLNKTGQHIKLPEMSKKKLAMEIMRLIHLAYHQNKNPVKMDKPEQGLTLNFLKSKL